MDSPMQEKKSLSHGLNSYHEHEDSECIGHEPCPKCGSKDNLGRYTDGHGYCFGCSHREPAADSSGVLIAKSTRRDSGKAGDYQPISGTFKEVKNRNVTEETARRFSYSHGEYKGKKCHIANFKRDGLTVGQKLRFKDKSFKTFGDCSSLWGKQLWGKGKKIVITEGELDALSVAQAQNCKWPVVSLPHGAASAKKIISKEIEWLLGNFDEIILMFDMDGPGQTAATESSELFPPGRCLVACLPCKDASEVLTTKGGSVLVDSIWKAKVCRPDGIVAGEDTWDLIKDNTTSKGLMYPWKGLNDFTLGARRGELVTFCAGTGAGKSTAVKEIASYFHSKGETIGYIALEESVRNAAVDFMSIEADEMLHLRNNLDDKFCRGIWESVFSDNRLYLYDHWGSVDVGVLANRIRYLAHNCNVGWIVLDHISIMVSGVEGGDERRLIDNIMTTIRSLAEELNIGMFIVSHLKRPTEGNKGHEDGRQISLSHLRGSGSISQLSDFVIGLERDQQGNGSTNVRVLKARYKGSKTGLAGELSYNGVTGRLKECGGMVGQGGATGVGQEDF